MIKKITRQRFNALCFSRKPQAKIFMDELEWYSDLHENVLGFLILDFEGEYGYILLGRDEIGRYRCVDLGVSIEDHKSALKVMLGRMDHFSSESVFPQGDVKTKKNEIYLEIVGEEKLHPSYKVLTQGKGFTPAKEIIKEAVFAYVDVDGNYIEQFQSTGFDSRIWELYLFVTFYDLGFQILREYPAPDYVLGYGVDQYFCVEAVTVNPTQNPKDPVPAPPKNKKELEELTRGYIPIKFASTLYSKLCKEYWKQPHISGRPLLFAIADFHQEGSMMWSRTGLVEYLYGLRTSSSFDKEGKLIIKTEKIEFHEYMSTKRPSGFFYLPNAENISGVLFSNHGTIAKFNRMGKLAGFGDSSVKMVMTGYCHDHDPNAVKPEEFSFKIEEGNYEESWVEGMTLFHNPNALFPLDPHIFPEAVGQFFLKDGLLTSILPKFYPYDSRTFISTEEKRDGRVLDAPSL